ncbi:hypothetical protein [Streptomyces sp. sk226]|uniref:hypothetical protein n=1 Tax=Streptomyces sp. sk226 TaxID=2034268 RepID=UPI000BEF6DD2|nr:hypothetical protein [Streptomyces sp. sk226]
MPDTSPTPADQLRAAAERARETGDPLHTVLAPLLEAVAVDAIRCRCVPECPTGAALAVARQLLGTTSEDTAAEPPSYPWSQTMHTSDGERTVHIPWDGPDGTTAGSVRVTASDRAVLAAMLADGAPAVPPAPADRAAALHEAADALAAEYQRRTAPGIDRWNPLRARGLSAGMAILRRLAGEAAAGADTVLAAAIPEWEAVYEPSDYLIGYANSEAAAKGAAIAWVLTQTDKTADRLEWNPTPHGDDHDEHFELSERHDDGIDTAVGVTVQRRLRPYTAADFAPEETR